VSAPNYSVVIVQRYRVLRDGVPVPGGPLHTDSAGAQMEIQQLKKQDAAVGRQRERDAQARAQKGKWTPASLRAAMTSDPHWEVEDIGGRALGVDLPEGRFKCVWHELDKEHPVDREGRPNFEIYGSTYIVQCHDQLDRHGVQFELRDPSGDRGREWKYVTADRLAAALIKRGLLQVPA
jgi:hypothetical protein